MPPNPRLAAALDGRYVIEREIGQGGMAMVYLARDVRHDRQVALKVLRPELAAVIGAERFLAEIKTTANLQHPHILPLHDSGEADGTVFYVMPYVTGETLRERMQHERQLPVDDAVRIAREVASALDYAHRQGVVHRDIKPENILLHDGQALVADFGISLAVSRSDGGTRMTETGMSLGTPHYMAPEQAMGEREITAKADVYALGCVLYEMLTGEPPFTGSTAQAIVARAITEQPRGISIQRHTVPAHIEATTLKALEKLPADRFASAADFAAALDNRAFTRSDVGAAEAPSSFRAGQRRSRAALPLAAFSVVATALLLWAYMRPAPDAPVSRYALSFDSSSAPMAQLPIAVSPDGSHLVYVGPQEGAADATSSQLWIKSRDKSAPVPLAGTRAVQSFTFSPDGQWLAYSQNDKLKKIPISGGAAITLTDSVAALRGVAWLDDGTIVIPKIGSTELLRVSDVGGPISTIWRGDTTLVTFPEALPGSRGVLFTLCGGTTCSVMVTNPGDTSTQLVARGAVRAFYVPTGHLVYSRPEGGMLALAFNPRTLKAGDAPVPLLDSIMTGVNGSPAFAVSSEGTVFTRAGGTASAQRLYELAWLDRSGRRAPVDSSFRFALTGFGSTNAGWQLSPDGNRVVMGLNTDAGDNIWVKQLPRGPLSRISFDSTGGMRPRWSRDGRSVTYIGRNGALVRRRADGTGKDEELIRVKNANILEGVFTPDEKSIVFRSGGGVGPGGRDIMIETLGADSTPKPLIASREFDESGIAISPDGRWIAYEGDEAGRSEIFVRPFPDVDAGKFQVSSGGGRSALWSRNGRELFFVNAAREIVIVTVAPGAAFKSGEPKTLFKLPAEYYLDDPNNYTPFDISPDGQRFLMARLVQATDARNTPLVVTENWFTELKRIVNKR
ncbi:MAG: protein kinase domain-containing protein [Gemmatimonadaceae bacterium]